ncbi:hypothetical protein L2W42_28125 (plasmid) [Rhizobium gallicum]|nr:hypothetical protein [Rhizobium gallicum]ULJ76278.1 hypothetical protein L2W42_28125 [Rhizobium gallicum]
MTAELHTPGPIMQERCEISRSLPKAKEAFCAVCLDARMSVMIYGQSDVSALREAMCQPVKTEGDAATAVRQQDERTSLPGILQRSIRSDGMQPENRMFYRMRFVGAVDGRIPHSPGERTRAVTSPVRPGVVE